MASDDEYQYDSDDVDDYEYDDEDEDTTMVDDEEDDDDEKLDSNALLQQQQQDMIGGGRGRGVRMIPANDFFSEMKKYVDETTEITGLSSDIAMVLLNQYRWSKDNLIEEYCSGDPDAVLKKYGVHYHVNPVKVGVAAAVEDNNKKRARFTRFSSRRSSSSSIAAPPPKKKTCPICYDEEDDGDSGTFHSVPCGHSFCGSCWYGYVSTAIEGEGPGCVCTLKCPESNCGERLTMGDVTMALSSSSQGGAAAAAQSMQQKYELFQLRSFIESCDLTCWCPGTDCDMIACASSLYDLECANKEAKCTKCETSFCVSCGGGQEAHSPCPCSILKTWKKKCKDDGMNAQWLVANTKSCPKCARRIQKNGGCNHMTCRSGAGCGHEFCWLCLADWRTHRQCNTFNTTTEHDLPNDAAARNARTELERYTHYQDRYKSHDQGQQYAQKKWDELKTTEPTSAIIWDQILIARNANKLLTRCRRVLKYTYAYGYMVFGMANVESLQKERFEDRQQQLESFTERLSEETEKDNINDIVPTKVADLSGVLHVFIKNMIECLDDDDDDDDDNNSGGSNQMMMG